MTDEILEVTLTCVLPTLVAVKLKGDEPKLEFISVVIDSTVAATVRGAPVTVYP